MRGWLECPLAMTGLPEERRSGSFSMLSCICERGALSRVVPRRKTENRHSPAATAAAKSPPAAPLKANGKLFGPKTQTGPPGPYLHLQQMRCYLPAGPGRRKKGWASQQLQDVVRSLQ